MVIYVTIKIFKTFQSILTVQFPIVSKSNDKKSFLGLLFIKNVDICLYFSSYPQKFSIHESKSLDRGGLLRKLMLRF